MISPTELFVRRFDELVDGLRARDDFELLKVASVLRSLLIDERALIHQVNAELRHKIRFRVNDVGTIEDVPIRPDVLFHGVNLDPATVRIESGIKELTLAKFLKQSVIEAEDTTVTIRDVIKFAANKAGGVHFDPKRTNEEKRLDRVVDRLSALGVHSLGIALQTISRITLVALRPLREAIVRLPGDIAVFAHYKLERGGMIQFAGRGQFLETNLAHELKQGWSWNAVVRIKQQAEPGTRILYELGNLNGNPPRLRLVFTELGELKACAAIDVKTKLEAILPKFNQTLLFDRFAYISFGVRYSREKARLDLYTNNELANFAEAFVESPPKCISRQTIGASLSGTDSASFEIRELVIADQYLTGEQRQKVAKYFWLQWHD